MKKLFSLSILLLILAFIVTISACKKKSGDSTCKSCKAFGVDGLAGQREVCSEADEAKFRSDFSGKEISCN